MEQPLRHLIEASTGVCRPLWVLPFDRKGSRSALRLLKAQGELGGDVLDASKMSASEAAEALGERRPHGIVCLIDETIMWTAEVANRIDLPFHTLPTATQLTDKFEQRTALRAYGLPTPDFWKAEDVADEGVAADVMRKAGFPVVLKPRRGTSGRDSEPLRSEQALREAAAAVEPETMLIEAYIPDPTTAVVGPGSAPYASVELAVSDGVISVFGVTGRTPLAEPFRETGQIFPADVDPATRSALIDAASAATRALGITNGVLHVEIKITDDGPVVIEVNGRPGGLRLREIVKRATGVDLIQLEMRLALGERFAYTDVETRPGVDFMYLVQPNMNLRRITSVDGLDAVRAIPGVERVVPGIAQGSAFSWRTGTLSFAAEISGTAADHEAARRIRDQVLASVVVSGE